MQTIVLLLLTVVLFQSAHSQSGWVQVQTGVSASFINDFFLDENTGWLCGTNGTIAKTTNGGINWTVQQTGLNYELSDLWFIDASTGWAAGGIFESPGTTNNRMIVCKTTDGGSNWVQVLHETDFDNRLSAIYFRNSQEGFALGRGGNGSATTGVIRRTLNGGSNWFYNGFRSTVKKEVSRESVVWVISNYFDDIGNDSAFLLNSTNAGVSWNTVLSTTSLRFLDLNILEDGEIKILCTMDTVSFLNGLLSSTDGGQNWTMNTFLSGTAMSNIEFINQLTGWGGGPRLLKTTNGGLSWPPQLEARVNGISMFDSLKGIAYGNAGVVYTTSTGGVVNVEYSSSYHPEEFELSQNFPNPFNPSTTIRFGIRTSGNVSLKVYDVLGREVAVLADEYLRAGSYERVFEAGNLSSGVYFYTLRVTSGQALRVTSGQALRVTSGQALRAGEFEKTLRMIVVR